MYNMPMDSVSPGDEVLMFDENDDICNVTVVSEEMETVSVFIHGESHCCAALLRFHVATAIRYCHHHHHYC